MLDEIILEQFLKAKEISRCGKGVGWRIVFEARRKLG